MAFNLYPLSSASGKAIPLDVYQPVEHRSFTVSPVPFASPEQFTAVNLTSHMLILFPTVDVTIAFNSTSAVLDASYGDIWIPSNSIVPIYTEIPYISGISLETGEIHINIVKLWDSLATEVQQSVG